MLIILDRDGVINYESGEYIKSPEEWLPLPGSLDAIAALHQANHQIVVATNQSGLARGLFTADTLEQIHLKMRTAIEKAGGHLDGIFFCPHHPDAHCYCRKPQPGLLLQIAEKFNTNLNKNAVLIGDSLRDIQAAQAVGCDAILVRTGNGLKTSTTYPDINVPVFDNLAAVANALLNKK